MNTKTQLTCRFIVDNQFPQNPIFGVRAVLKREGDDATELTNTAAAAGRYLDVLVAAVGASLSHRAAALYQHSRPSPSPARV